MDPNLQLVLDTILPALFALGLPFLYQKVKGYFGWQGKAAQNVLYVAALLLGGGAALLTGSVDLPALGAIDFGAAWSEWLPDLVASSGSLVQELFGTALAVLGVSGYVYRQLLKLESPT